MKTSQFCDRPAMHRAWYAVARSPSCRTKPVRARRSTPLATAEDTSR